MDGGSPPPKFPCFILHRLSRTTVSCCYLLTEYLIPCHTQCCMLYPAKLLNQTDLCMAFLLYLIHQLGLPREWCSICTVS